MPYKSALYISQAREDGLPGTLDPVPIPVGVVPEQAPETAPLPAILNAALVTAPPLKRVEKAIAAVSIDIPHLITLSCAYRVVNHICIEM